MLGLLYASFHKYAPLANFSGKDTIRMFYSPDASIDTFLIHGKQVLDYLEGQPEAQTLLARYGVDGSRLQECKSLLDQVQGSHWQMHAQVRQQKASTVTLHNTLQMAQLLYRRHRQAARKTLSSDASALLRKQGRTYANWLAEAQEFYAALLNNPLYQEQLATLDITADQLLRASQVVNGVVANKTNQTQNREESRTTRLMRDVQLEEAKAWFTVLMAVARVAFRHQPGMIEALETLAAPKKKGKAAENGEGEEVDSQPPTSDAPSAPAVSIT